MSATAFGLLVQAAAWLGLGAAFLLGRWGPALACFGVLAVLASTRRPFLPPKPDVARTVAGEPVQGGVLQVTVTGSAPTAGLVKVEAPVPMGLSLLRETRTVARGRFELTQELQAVAVGEAAWPKVELRFTDVWGLQAEVVEVDCPAPLTILPSPEWALRGRRLGLKHPVQITIKAPVASERSLEIDRVRPYAAGDPMRDIDWKSTARFQDLQLRERERHIPRPITVLLDCGPTMRVQRHDLKLLSAVRVAHGALAVASGAGTTSHLVSIHESGCQSRPVAGLRDAEVTLREILATCPPLRPEQSHHAAIPVDGVLHAVGKAPGLQLLIVDGEADPELAVELLPLLKLHGSLAIVLPATAAHLYRRREARGPVLPAMRRWRANRKRVQEAAAKLRVPVFLLRPGDEGEVLQRFGRLLG